ncbi:MAG: hypothetical protein LBD73_03125 [Deferribacteraceae bacterium]|jgi:hypothetical protein|nr:hypothetical protein [Deferribacteraceae bacterium]
MGSDSDSLSKSPLLTKLFEAGIRVKPDIEVSGKYADVFPYYRGNPGFYHIFEGKGEAILLKGVFGDNIRIIKKGISLTGDDFSQIARFLFEVKKALNPVIDESYKLRLIITECEIIEVEAE